MSPRARPAIIPAAVDVQIQVSPVWSAGRYAVRLTVGKREPVDLSTEQAGRLVADLAAALRLAQHHEESHAARAGGATTADVNGRGGGANGTSR